MKELWQYFDAKYFPKVDKAAYHARISQMLKQIGPAAQAPQEHSQPSLGLMLPPEDVTSSEGK